MSRLDFVECKASFIADDAGTVTGKAWDFASPDRTGDVIEPAAFAGAIGKSLPMLFAHDQAQAVGVWNGIAVDSDGLSVTGKLLVDDVARAKEVRALLQAKAVTGLSVGFITKKALARKGGGRTISDLDLVEVSLVAVPAHDRARVSTVKDMSNMTTATTAVAAEEKKTAEPEKKDVAVATKALDAITKRLDAIEAKANRPGADNDNKKVDDVEAKALNQWARTGQVDAELKTLAVGTPSAGGYTVAPEYSTNIIKKIAELSPIRGLASVMSIGTGKVYIPTLETDAATSWVSETGSRSSTEPTFGQVDIDVYEQSCVIPVSRTLLEDSMVDLAAFLADRMAIKFAQAEASAFVVGDGSGKPTGLLHTPGNYETVEADQDGSDIIEKLIELFYTLPADYAARGTWAMNRKTAGVIRKAADAVSTRSSIWSDGIANGTPAMLLGAPVSYWPDLDDLASIESGPPDTYPIVFGDFASAYQIVDRVGLDILRDDYTGADNGIVKFSARRRVGGKPILSEAAVVLTGVGS
jgi:HK97 family phage major capsid protein/HK97 family phage prohead protease